MTKIAILGTTTGEAEVQPREDETIQVVEASEQVAFIGSYVTDGSGVTLFHPAGQLSHAQSRMGTSSGTPSPAAEDQSDRREWRRYSANTLLKRMNDPSY